MSIWGYIASRLGQAERESDSAPGAAPKFAQRALHDYDKHILAVQEVGGDELALHAAEKMLATKSTDDCIATYRTLASQCPTKRNVCELKIAQAYQNAGNYCKAIEYLMYARVHGAPEFEVDEAFWQVTENQYQNQGENPTKKEPIKKYLLLFPKGKYVIAANIILSDMGC